MASDRSIEDVLREMDEAVTYSPSGSDVARWLEVLRPVLMQFLGPKSAPLTTWWTGGHPTADPHVEVFPIKSGLPQRLLRDLGITIELRADHEGTGEIRMDYTAAPPEHRLQALLSVMGAIGDRIAYAIGNEAYVNLLRGIMTRRERES